MAPVRKAALSWVQDGRRRFSKGHWVSGMEATMVMNDSRDAMATDFPVYLQEVVNVG